MKNAAHAEAIELNIAKLNKKSNRDIPINSFTIITPIMKDTEKMELRVKAHNATFTLCDMGFFV